MSDPRDGLGKFLLNLCDGLNQVFVIQAWQLYSRIFLDIIAESLMRRFFSLEVNGLRISRDRTAALCLMLSMWSRNFKSESMMTPRSLVWSTFMSGMSSMQYCCEKSPFLELVLIGVRKTFSLAKLSCHFLLHEVRELMLLWRTKASKEL